MSESTTAAALVAFEGDVSPYGAAKIVNAYLKEAGVDKILPPQMFYTYVKKGYITSVEGKVNAANLNEWLVKYLTKNAK